MRKPGLSVLIASTVALSVAHAQSGGLRGLEMDVMEAGESPAEATARIALPGPAAVAGNGAVEEAGLATDRAHGSPQAGEAAALDTHAPAGSEAAGNATRDLPESNDQATAAGEPTSLDGGTMVDGGGDIIGEEPADPGATDGGPGDIGIIEPGGTVDDIPVTEPPFDGPPPVEPPTDDVPIGDDPDGGVVPGDDGSGTDASGGAEGSIEPLPVETSDGHGPTGDPGR